MNKMYLWYINQKKFKFKNKLINIYEIKNKN